MIITELYTWNICCCFSLTSCTYTAHGFSVYKPMLGEWIGYRNHLGKKAQWFDCYTMASKFKTEFEGHSNENSWLRGVKRHFLGLGTSYSLQILILHDYGMI